jgi:DNA invertase Pin-like site-specific DNA recombinase
LARSTRDLLNILDTVAKAGAGFKSLADSWADTTTAQGRLMLTILGGLAEFERELILARTGDGRKRAKPAGVRFGRPPPCISARRPSSGSRKALRKLISRGLVSQATISRLQPSPFEDATRSVAVASSLGPDFACAIRLSPAPRGG